MDKIQLVVLLKLQIIEEGDVSDEPFHGIETGTRVERQIIGVISDEIEVFEEREDFALAQL